MGMVKTIIWKKPLPGQVPDGDLLVEVDTKSGSDVALVYIGDEDDNTLYDIEHGDVWTAGWTWANVSRFVVLEDVLADLGSA